MIVPFKPQHLLAVEIQENESARFQTERHGRFLEQGYCSYTCLNAQGEPMACAGIVPMWPGRAMAWASLSFRAGTYLKAITRRTRIELECAPFTRIEMYIRPDFPQAVRWATVHLGFKYEATMECGGVDGRDLWVFVRIKDLVTPAVKRLRNGSDTFDPRRG
jgi:hypothetical protein